jgi:copper transport protein
LVAGLLAIIVPTRPALAHASLLAAAPADGVTIPEPPKTFRLEFNEPASPLAMRLVSPDGQITALAEVHAENSIVTIAAPAMPKQGSYALSWRVISADGHPVGGVVSFAVGHPSAAVSAPPFNGAAAVHAALWLSQFVISLGLIIGVGGAAFAAWLAAERPTAASPFLAAVMIGGIAAAAPSLSFQGLDVLAEPLWQGWRPSVWAAGFATAWGSTALLALATLIAGLFALRSANRVMAKALSVIAVIGVGLAFDTSGHAGTTAPRVAIPAAFLHAVCVTLWAGSLLPLALAVRGGDQVALRRFSSMIPTPLVVLIATGIVLTIVNFDRPDALWTTAFGLVLAAKLGLVLAMLGLAALNRYALVPRLAVTGVRRLVMITAVEFTLAVVILGLVGLWRFTPPPRALAATEMTYIHFHGLRAMTTIELTPERDRGASATIDITDDDSSPIAAQEVGLVIWNTSAGIQPIRTNAHFEKGSRWRVDGIHIPVAGVWRMRVEILVSDFDKIMLEDNVELPRAP